VTAGFNQKKLCCRAARNPSTAVLALVVLAGCGSHQSNGGIVTQVVARINGHELTVSQLNRELLNGGDGQGDPDQLRQAALDRLISRELIVQAAEAEKLDRESLVAAQIGESRRRVLARAYAEQKVFPADQLDDAQLRTFYEQHPLLFKKRRVFHAVLFTVADAAKVPQQLSSQLTQMHSADGVRALLGHYGVEAQQESTSRAAEDLAPDWLPKLATSSAGELVQLKGPNGQLQIMLLTGIDDASIVFDEARPRIRRYLQVKRNEDALESYIATQRASAEIVYGEGHGASPSSQ